MSTLRVGNITATGGTGTITVPTGNQIVQAGAVLQVVSTTKTDSFSTTSATFVDVTGVSVSITPSATSSKILVLVDGVVGNTASANLSPINLVRNSTNIAQSTGAGTANATITIYTNNAINNSGFSISFLDSPSTTSSVTYKLQTRTNNAGSSATIGRIAADTNWGSITSITVMEIAG